MGIFLRGGDTSLNTEKASVGEKKWGGWGSDHALRIKHYRGATHKLTGFTSRRSRSNPLKSFQESKQAHHSLRKRLGRFSKASEYASAA